MAIRGWQDLVKGRVVANGSGLNTARKVNAANRHVMQERALEARRQQAIARDAADLVTRPNMPFRSTSRSVSSLRRNISNATEAKKFVCLPWAAGGPTHPKVLAVAQSGKEERAAALAKDLEDRKITQDQHDKKANKRADAVRNEVGRRARDLGKKVARRELSEELKDEYRLIRRNESRDYRR